MTGRKEVREIENGDDDASSTKSLLAPSGSRNYNHKMSQKSPTDLLNDPKVVQAVCIVIYSTKLAGSLIICSLFPYCKR